MPEDHDCAKGNAAKYTSGGGNNSNPTSTNTSRNVGSVFQSAPSSSTSNNDNNKRPSRAVADAQQPTDNTLKGSAARRMRMNSPIDLTNESSQTRPGVVAISSSDSSSSAVEVNMTIHMKTHTCTDTHMP